MLYGEKKMQKGNAKQYHGAPKNTPLFWNGNEGKHVSEKRYLLKKMLFQLRQQMHWQADAIGTAILSLRLEDGVIQYANRAACQMLDLKYQQLLYRRYEEIFCPDLSDVCKHLLYVCDDEEEHTTIHYWSERNRWLQMAGRRISGRACMLLTITDVTAAMFTETPAETQSLFDNLLKIPNGTKLEEDINDLASVGTVALLYLSIEGLKV
ncbi:hypothetical protein LJC20_04840, partial [Eubacteriales bacterium OttesenSCG-928-M02]|nr:hypothetical protein [Eubacteriales bacterium OttesenSCG-928-M02]